MTPEKISLLLVLAFFSIVYIQSGVDKVIDYSGNISFLYSLLGNVFSKPLIKIALISVTILEVASGILCVVGIFDVIFNSSYLTCQLGLVIGSLALLILLFGQRVSKNYEGAKTLAIYFTLSILGILLSQPFNN